jgi:hypothetical protein
MNRRVWTGILAGVLAATVILGVAGTAYRVGQNHEVAVTRTVGDGEVVRVIGGYGYGHGGGFFFFPLFTVLLVFLLLRAFRGGRRGPWGAGCGTFDERHRRAHDRVDAGSGEA